MPARSWNTHSSRRRLGRHDMPVPARSPGRTSTADKPRRPPGDHAGEQPVLEQDEAPRRAAELHEGLNAATLTPGDPRWRASSRQ